MSFMVGALWGPAEAKPQYVNAIRIREADLNFLKTFDIRPLLINLVTQFLEEIIVDTENEGLMTNTDLVALVTLK
jgi:hypothetical protein